MKIPKIFFISFTILLGFTAPLAADSVGVNFTTGSADEQLASGDTAGLGAVAQNNWNNVAGASGGPTALNDDSGSASGVSVTWSASGTWQVNFGTPADNDSKLMNGYLDAISSATTVNFAGIPYAEYDVYIYYDGDNAAGFSGTYAAGGASNANLPDNANWPITTGGGTYTLTENSGEVGNVTVLRGLSGATLAVSATIINTRAPVNAIQIVEANSTQANVAVTCFVVGPHAIPSVPPGATGTVADGEDFSDKDAIVMFPNGRTGGVGDAGYQMPTLVATHGEVGATFGLATIDQIIYAGAYLKRGSGFGPLGPGGIYRIDVSTPSSPVVQNYATIPNAGTDPHDFQYGGAYLTVVYDEAAQDSVAKMSLGDVELSPSGTTLYVINLNDRHLYSLPANSATVPVPAAAITDLGLIERPAGCNADDFRPFGLGFSEDGVLHIGAVCSDESGTSADGLRGYVLRYDGTSGATANTTSVLDFHLARPVHNYGPIDSWRAWPPPGTSPTSFARRTTPMLTDLEFLDGDELVLGLRSRFGDGDFRRTLTVIGEVLKACHDGSNWVLEAQGSCGGVAGEAAVGNPRNRSVGPGNADGTGPYGHFFDQYDSIDATSGMGTLAYDGTTLLSTISDEYHFLTGGLAYYDPATGIDTPGYEIYRGGDHTFQKTAGLGDMEMLLAPEIGIGNLVFYDANNDGDFDPGTDTPIQGVTVELYNAGDTPGTDTPVDTTTTAADGTYRLSTTTAGNYFVHIPEAEFQSGGDLENHSSSPGAGGDDATDDDGDENGIDNATPSSGGISSGTIALAFGNEPLDAQETGYKGGTDSEDDDFDYTVDFGFHSPCPVQPGSVATACPPGSTEYLAVPCYINGDPLAGGVSGTMDAFVVFPYGSSGQPGDAGYLPPIHSATAAQIGACWATSYDPNSNAFYTAAVMRRHMGLGPLGLGGIYKFDIVTGQWSNFLDVDALPGVDLGTISRTAYDGLPLGPNELPADPTVPNWDVDAFAQVAKVGIGGMDFSADGNTLWVMNLNDRELLEIDVSGASPALTAKRALPDPGSSNGTHRPWAVKVHNGKVFVGMVSDASGGGGTAADLRAHLWAWDPAAAQWCTVYDFPLDYNRNTLHSPDGTASDGDWEPWQDAVAWQTPLDNDDSSHPQPILSDLEFDVDGSIIVAFIDRYGMQLGYQNYLPDTSRTDLIAVFGGGEILRVGISGGSYALENNGVAGLGTGGSVTTSAANTLTPAGPGGREFYWGEYFNYFDSTTNPPQGTNGFAHTETGMGSIAFKPGSGEVVATIWDTHDVNNGGVATLSNTDGSSIASGRYLIYPNLATTLFGKGVGLGDLELACLPETLAIGNLVFYDNNGNGSYEAGSDTPAENVTVELYANGTGDGLPYATMQTGTGAQAGCYLFTNLVPGAYSVKVAAANFRTGGILVGWESSPGSGSGDDDQNEDGGDGTIPIAEGILSGPIILGSNGPTGAAESGKDGASDDSDDAATNLTIDFGLVQKPCVSVVYEITLGTDDGYERLSDGLIGDRLTRNQSLVADEWVGGLRFSGIAIPSGAVIDEARIVFTANNEFVSDSGTFSLSIQGEASDNAATYTNVVAGISGRPDTTASVPWTIASAWPNSFSGAETTTPDLASLVQEIVDRSGWVSGNALAFTFTGSGAGNGEIRYWESFEGATAIGEPDRVAQLEICYSPRVALGSTVWIDDGTANGTFDVGEGVSGVAVELYLSGQTPGVDTPVATTATGTDGAYQFDGLGEGDYIVYIPGSQFGLGEPLAGVGTLSGGSVDNNLDNDDDGLDTPENGGIRSNVINLTAGSEVSGEPTQALYTGILADANVNMTVDFGFEAAGAAGVAVGSVVWIDGQGSGASDGTFDDPSEGVDGVTVELYRADQTPGVDSPVAVTTTTGGGQYFFDQLPEGSYIVHLPAANFASGPLSGASSLSGAGGDDGTDNDDNGLDAPVNGGVSSAAVALAVDAEPTTGDDDSGYSGSLDDNDVDATVDFGFNASTGVVAVGSRIWKDDGDGIYQSGEGADGVVVELYTSGQTPGIDDPVAMTVTTSDGFYLFDQLPAGSYIVHLPAGNFASGPLAGATSLAGADSGDLDESVASNENGLDTPVNGGVSSGTVALAQDGEPTGESSQADYSGSLDDDDVNMTVDFAFDTPEPDPALGNAVFIDADGDGVMDPGEGVNGVTVELYTADQEPGVDTPVRSTVTVADGNYLFDLLPEDDYIVYLPEGNFAPGAPLYQYESLPGAGGDDTLDDNADENGLDQRVNGGIVSAVILIREGGEPINEGGSATGPTSALSDDSVNYTVDFGFHQSPPLGATGNYVWVDENSDGYQDEGEPGIPNVTVQLKDENGAVIATTVTDSHGGYLFSELRAGSYFVDIDESTVPAGMTQTTPSTNAGGDFGNQEHSGTGYPVTIGGNEPWVNLTADFGYNHNPDTDVNTGINEAALGDRVWIDDDRDGVQGRNEIGVSGVELTLVTAGPDGFFGTADDVDGPTTTTDDNGYYLFDGLTPGAYQVRVTDSATASHDVLGAAFEQTGDPDHFATADTSPANNDNLSTAPVVLGPGDVFLNVDFGYDPTTAPVGSIGDTVWRDIDADGIQDVNEDGIEGVTVALIKDVNQNGVFDSGDKVIATDTTDGNGTYLFTGLPVDDGGGDSDADYLVWVNDTGNVLNGLTQTYDFDGVLSSPDLSATALTSGDPVDLDQDFGYTPAEPLGSIGDYVWLDRDGEGDQDEPAAGIPGVLVELLDHTGNVVATTTTDFRGYYLFTGLPVEDNTGAAGADYTVRVAASNFGGGAVLENHANTYDPDDGTSSPDSTGGTVTLAPAAPHDREQDFGYNLDGTQAAGDPVGSIGDTVWFDADSSGGDQGTQGSEPGIPCVLVTLYQDDGDGIFEPGTDDPLVGQQYTDAQGNYLFTGLPLGETYFVEVDPQSLPAFVDNTSTHEETTSGETVAGNSLSDATPTAGAPHVTDQDFSYPPAGGATDLGFLGDFVWFDADNSGGNQAAPASQGESGLEGVTVVLKDHTGTEIARTTTDENGYYAFIGLPLDDGQGDNDADYGIEVDTSTLPNYVSRTSTHDGTDGGSDSTSTATLTSASPSDLDQDFSYPPAIQLGAIGDYVWLDADGENDQDETGAGVQGVIVELLDEDGDVIGTATTDVNGGYLFPNLPLDTYQVRVADENFDDGGVLEGLTHTGTATSGTDGDTLPQVTLTGVTPVDLDQDFGYRGSGTPGSVGNLVWLDQNADGVWDGENGPDGLGGTDDDEPLIAGVTVDLYRDLDGDGLLDPGEPRIGTTTTVGTITTTGGDDGNYLFTGLATDDGSGSASYVVDVSDRDGVLAGYWHSLGSPGVTDNSQSDPYAVSIDAGTPDDFTADFGYYVDPAKVGNFVWFDADDDGQQDSGEPGIDGVEVTLTIDYPGGATVTLKTLTGDDPSTAGVTEEGWYSFCNLLLDEDYNGDGVGSEPTYTISVATPPGYEPGKIDEIGAGITDRNDGDDPAGTAAQPVQGLEEVTQNALPDNESDVASYDFNFVSAKADTFVEWQGENPLGGENGPLENPDGDIYPNLLEYALCLHPDSGTPSRTSDPDERGGFCTELSASGTVDAFFVRPRGGLADVTYVLEHAAALGDPTTWTPVAGIVPTVTDNGDGSETVRYADLGGVYGDYGFVRLRVDLDDGSTQASSATEVFGWDVHMVETQCETCNYPYLNKDAFSGAFGAGDLSGGVVDVTGSAGSGVAGGVSAQLEAGREYYMEMTGGPYEGHRFELDEGATGAETVALEGGAARDTLVPAPADLSGSFVVRAHVVLDEAAPPEAFAAENSSLSGDRALVYGSGGWKTYWVYDEGGTRPAQWTDTGDSSLADVGGSVVLGPCEGFYVHPRGGTVELTGVGMVRSNVFACPLEAGYNLVGSGYPLDQTPRERAMLRDASDGVARDYFAGAASPLQSDQLLFWLGDATTGAEGYRTYYRVEVPSTAYDYWTDQTESALGDHDDTVLFELRRGVFIDSQAGHDRSDPADVWVWPLPWSP